MPTTDFVSGTTLTDAAWFDDTDIATYAYLTSPAGTNTITATGPATFTYVAGRLVRFIPAATNTGATTINITPSGGTALGARNIFFGGAACVGGELRIDRPAMLVDDGTRFNLLTPHVPSTLGFFRKNAVTNGDFAVAQRGTSFTSTTTPANNDDTYLLDQWTLLSAGNDIVDVSRSTSVVPTGGLYSILLDVETANQKFGIIHFIEQKNCKGFIGETCTLSFQARYATGATVQTMRAVILAWSGTADSVTSDVVSVWGASGTNPTLVANWTAENTAADLTLTTAFQTFSVTAAIDTASATNIAVFLYYNNANGTVGDFIYITDVQLEAGGVATEFDYRDIQEEEKRCYRYLVSWALGASDAYASGFAISNVGYRLFMKLPVDMRIAPTLSVSAVGDFDLLDKDGNVNAATGLSILQANTTTVLFSATTGASASAAGDGTILVDDATGNSRLTLTAEL